MNNYMYKLRDNAYNEKELYNIIRDLHMDFDNNLLTLEDFDKYRMIALYYLDSISLENKRKMLADRYGIYL